MKIAIGQMESTDNLQANLDQALGLIKNAKSQEADLLVLPENFAMFSGKKYLSLAKQEDSHSIKQFLKDNARDNQLWIAAGTIPLMTMPSGEIVESGRVRSSCLLFDPSGSIVCRYDKMHLFDATISDAHKSYRESQYIEPGQEPAWCDTPFGRVGLAICYDLRFPELFRYYAANQVSLVLLPSAFTAETGKAHWEVLLRARAIENLMYIVGANQGGTHSKGRETWGHSMVVGPWGTVLAEAKGQKPELVTAKVDLSSVRAYRNKLPVLEHAKFRLSW